MKLEEFRIFQGQTRAVGNGLSIPSDGLRVGGEAVEVPQPSGSNEQGLGAQDHKLAGWRVVYGKTGEASAVEQQRRNKALVVALEVVELQESVIQGLHFEEASLISRHAGPRK